MDAFKITGYDKTKDVVTVDFAVAAREGFAPATFLGVKISGIPKDSVDSVKRFMKNYIEAYISGKIIESQREADIATEVKALLNVTTEV